MSDPAFCSRCRPPRCRPHRTDHRPLRCTSRWADVPTAFTSRRRGAGSARVPSHRGSGRAPVPPPDDRRSGHRELPGHGLRHAVARQVLPAGRLARRGVPAHVRSLRPDDPRVLRRAGPGASGGDGVFHRRAHGPLSRHPPSRPLPGHYRGWRPPTSSPAAGTTLDWLHQPDIHGGEASAAIVSGLVGPRSPDEYRWRRCGSNNAGRAGGVPRRPLVLPASTGTSARKPTASTSAGVRSTCSPGSTTSPAPRRTAGAPRPRSRARR